MATSDYTHLIEPLARHFWGEPNEQQSKPGEMRFGAHGSKSVDLDKSTFYDHEALRGGGVLDLVKYATEAKTRTRQRGRRLHHRRTGS